jgi:hypothetical protein
MREFMNAGMDIKSVEFRARLNDLSRAGSEFEVQDSITGYLMLYVFLIPET